jgi:hypothetical protein
MSKFTQVDDRGRLWQIDDLLPKEQADEITSTDWSTATTVLSSGQESWSRRQINGDNPLIQQYVRYINNCLPEINSALGTEFKSMAAGYFWIDLPGFTVGLHTDGHVPNSMQLYWTVPSDAYGTGFYHYKQPDSLLYQFLSRPNSGYIMLNHPDEDGSQPLIWHAMFNPVPEGSIRVSSYWRFT